LYSDFIIRLLKANLFSKKVGPKTVYLSFCFVKQKDTTKVSLLLSLAERLTNLSSSCQKKEEKEEYL
jgi:hypothetical protein